MASLRIMRAYCIELREVVTITQARIEFLSREPLLTKFHFLCSDEKCREKGVRVIGVNYRENAQESVKHVTAHYREQDTHLPGCEWQHEDDTEGADGLLPGESEDTARKRKARRKLNDFIDVFDPTDHDGTKPAGTEKPPIDCGGIGVPASGGNQARENNDCELTGVNRTNDLERLVESFRDAKEKLTDEEFSTLELQVKGIGKIKLKHYFQRLNYAKTWSTQRIIYGGAILDKRYGQGFRLKFYDTVEGKPVSLYVSPSMMKEYRHRKYLDGILSKVDEVRFLRVYALGHFEDAPNESDGLNLVISHLRHLAIVLGPTKNKATQ